MTDALIRPLDRPGDLGWVLMAHGELYTAEFGWNADFEAHVARLVADYAAGHDPDREAGWIAEVNGVRAGSVICVDGGSADSEDGSSADGSGGTAVLRILLVDPAARGHGLGKRLVSTCVEFATAAGYREVRLWTTHVLEAAQRRYREAGFRLVAEEPHNGFGPELLGRTYVLALQPEGMLRR